MEEDSITENITDKPLKSFKQDKENNNIMLKSFKRNAEYVRSIGGKPFQDRTKGEITLIAKKGGEVCSENKKEAARMRMIKQQLRKGAYSDADAAWLLQKLEDRPSMAVEVIKSLEKLKAEGVHPSQRVALLNTETQILKTIHGEKIKTENTNVNINVNITDVIREAYRKRMEKERESEAVDVTNER